MSASKPAPRLPARGRLARSMILFLLLLSTVPLLLMAGTAYWRSRGMLRDQVFTLLSSVITVQSERIQAEVQAGQLLLTRAAVPTEAQAQIAGLLAMPDPASAAFKAERSSLLNTLQAANHPQIHFNQFLLVDSRGVIRVSSLREWEGTALNADQIGFLKDERPRSQAVYNLQPIYAEALVIISTVPVVSADGAPLGSILGVAESPILRELMTKSAFYTTNHYFVTAEGVFIGVNPYPNSILRLVNLQPSEAQRAVVQRGLLTGAQRGVEEMTAFENQPVIAAYTWLPDLGIGWLADIPQLAVYGQLNSLLGFAFALFAATFALMAVINWQATTRFLRPILELAGIVQRFAAGQWDQRAPHTRDDEIGLLAGSFNHMADELTGLYQSLETQVEERTYLIRTSTEISQIAISSTNLDELLRRSVNLIVERFAYTYASIFLIEDVGVSPNQQVEPGRYAVLQRAAGPAEADSQVRGLLIRLDSTSTIGRVFMTNQPQVAAVHAPVGASSGRADLIAEAVTEAAVPIAIGEQVLGILNVQSLNPNGFSDDSVANLQTLANQIAPAIENFNLLEATQINLLETSLLYQASHQIAQVETVDQIYQVAQQAMAKTPYRSAFLVAEGPGFRLIPLAPPPEEMGMLIKLGKVSNFLAADPEQVGIQFNGPQALIFSQQKEAGGLPEALASLPTQLGCATAAFLPVWRAGKLAAILMLAVRAEETLPKGMFTAVALEPYTNLANLMISTIEKVQAMHDIQRRLAELRSLRELSQTISVETDMDSLYRAIHQQITALMGDVGFLIALYDPTHYQISVPYMVEAGEVIHVPPFPLGEGLTSILIRTGKPLMMVEDTLRKTQALGAKIIGAPAKSWLGVPLIFSGETLGALIVQDAEHEHRFTEDDERLLSTFSTQIAVILRNARLLEDSRRQAERERRLNEIASKLRHTTDFETILRTTTAELGRALHLSRAHIAVQVEAEPSAAVEPPEPTQEAQR